MEDAPSAYARPLDPARPVVRLDGASRRLLGETRPAQPAEPGRPACHDPGYVSNGVANLFVVAGPLRGRRAASVSDRRTRPDFARCVKEPVDVRCPAAERIVLVMDRLNTHFPASLYAAFPPTEAERPAGRPESHHTPKHGSWLNMAEIELSVLQRRCLRQRIADRDGMERAVAAWSHRRDALTARIDRQFTAADARTKLRRLYPAYEDRRTTRGDQATRCDSWRAQAKKRSRTESARKRRAEGRAT